MSEQPLPLVSIVTPSFNQAEFLEDAIRSVLGQDYPRIEYLVVDGGSGDGSVDIIKQYAGQLAHWESTPDEGQSSAINKGLRMASGDIVAWLNSDDVYMPGAIAEAVELLRRNPEVGMVYSDGLMVDSDLRLLDPHRYRTLDVADLLSFEVILQPTVFMRKSILEEIGYLDESYDLILDHELWLRIAGSYPLMHVPRYWALERTHGRAKTIHAAEGFVRESRRMIETARRSGGFQEVFRTSGNRIEAGLGIFAARRLIDAGKYRPAVSHLVRAGRLSPRSVLQYWYKVVQAVGSVFGMGSLFMTYRSLRRRIQFGRRTVRLHYLDGGTDLGFRSADPG